MSMTENRCIEVLKKMKHMFTETCAKIDENTALDMAVEAIEEIQRYRAIGTVEGYERAIQISIENYSLYKEYKAKVQEFEAIGTIEELRELKEKAEPKKVDDDYCCPICHTYAKDDEGVAGEYCPNCGQNLDWE